MSILEFQIIAQAVLKQAQEREYDLISIDIDNIQEINEKYKFETTNDVIKKLGIYLQQAFYCSDSVISHGVSDEFYLLIKRKKRAFIEPTIATYVLPELLKSVANSFPISLSIGIAPIDDLDIALSELVNQANIARSFGKHVHKTTMIVFEETMAEQSKLRIKVLQGMDKAIKKNEFIVYFQPKISLTDNCVVGAEALVRWQSEEFGLIHPNQFIPIFEENEFIIRLDLYIFEYVCKLIQTSTEFNLPRLCINVSGVSLLNADYQAKILEYMMKYEIAPSKIELEITETCIINQQKQMIKRIKQLRSLGIAVSIDDFGAGESSLTRLNQIEVDTIKLDKAFLDFTQDNEKGLIIIENMILLSKQLGMQIVCEGVESAQQVAWLKSVGCDVAQGFYFAKPMNVDNFIEYLLRR